MAVKIRLSRQGGKKKPFYRVVVTDSESPRGGKFIEMVGTYNPSTNPPKAELKSDRVLYWLGKGAIPTEIVRHIIKRAGIKPEGKKAA